MTISELKREIVKKKKSRKKTGLTSATQQSATDFYAHHIRTTDRKGRNATKKRANTT